MATFSGRNNKGNALIKELQGVKMRRTRKLNNYATKFAIFSSGKGTSTELSTAFIIETNILRIRFSKVPLGELREFIVQGIL